tara:strand:+ start:29894 stop:30961 length:1068 start_codon:yes stop_codon:yes gene_type:complete
MNAAFVFEILASLCVQVGIVIAATTVIERWLWQAKAICQLWSACFVVILTMTASALLLPHVRWIAAPNHEMLLFLNPQRSLLTICISLWSAGLAFVVIRRAVHCLRLVWFLNSCCAKMTPAEIAALPVEQTMLPAEIRWLVSDEVIGPFCWQLHRPTIVLPRYALSEDAQVLQHMVLHEVEHLRRNHPLQTFLQGVCGSVFWFHPAQWIAGRHAALAREYLCDEAAARTKSGVSAYLWTLAKVAERHAAMPIGSLAFGRRDSAIVRRSQRLTQLTKRPPKCSPARRRFALVALILVSVGVSQVWLPLNSHASSRSRFSPWPAWTASVLHDLGYSVRDFEMFDERHDFDEWTESHH